MNFKSGRKPKNKTASSDYIHEYQRGEEKEPSVTGIPTNMDQEELNNDVSEGSPRRTNNKIQHGSHYGSRGALGDERGKTDEDSNHQRIFEREERKEFI